MEFERRGIASFLVVSDAFEIVACLQGEALGMPAMKYVVVPHPIGGRAVAEVREIARGVAAEVVARVEHGD